MDEQRFLESIRFAPIDGPDGWMDEYGVYHSHKTEGLCACGGDFAECVRPFARWLDGREASHD